MGENERHKNRERLFDGGRMSSPFTSQIPSALHDMPEVTRLVTVQISSQEQHP